MRDFNVVTKNLDKINKLGWYAEASDKDSDWVLLTFTPHGRRVYLTLSNEDFLDNLADVIDDFSTDDYMHQEVLVCEKKNIKPKYSEILLDAKWSFTQILTLYNELKGIDGFHDDNDLQDDECEQPDTRKKSKESDKQTD